MGLESKEIIQINATIIAGFIVLLTLVNLFYSPYAPRDVLQADQAKSYLIAWISTIVIIPFSVSAILASFESIRPAKWGMRVGFGALVSVLIYLINFLRPQ